jgi:glutathione synthase/RimK-type ligase-like ATP-grasp enzyme
MTALIYRRRKLGRTSAREISRFSTTGILNVRNDQPFPPNIDMVFRWGCTSNLPAGVTVVNAAEAIHQVADKAAFRKLTADAGLAPLTFLSFDDYENDLCNWYVGPVEFGDDPLPKTVVVRRATHHQGRFLDVCKTFGELSAACAKYGKGNYYISEYIPKIAECRVFIVSGRVVWVAQKTPGNPDDVAWNVARGGRFDNVRWDDWPLKAVRVAREAFLLSSLDFGGVDVMVDADGNAYVLEINSAPSQTSPYRQECTAKAFDYIVQYGKERIDVVQERGGYKKFIHPCLTNEAIRAYKEY